MAPSRGLTRLQWRSFHSHRVLRTREDLEAIAMRRSRDRVLDDILSCQAKHQVYFSTSNCPYANLAIEQSLLENSPGDSTVLLMYVNKPCVVIGRNQNPWLEVHLRRLEALRQLSPSTDPTRYALVRRRSGGGAVVHDRGNLNYSVIYPASEFRRDKYAELVASSLRKLGVASARVNERHDIVIDNNRRPGGFQQGAVHQPTSGPLKVSGSAYKLTKGRALHHGTCLLHSHLGRISRLLHSPGRAYIKARGVESVRSAIGNVMVGHDAFRAAVVKEFGLMHGLRDFDLESILAAQHLISGPGWAGGLIPDYAADTDGIFWEGAQKLKVRVTLLIDSLIQCSSHPSDNSCLLARPVAV